MIQPQIIFEDNHLIAAFKPANMPTQEDESGDVSLLQWVKHYIKIQHNKPGEVYLAMLHRLDRPVSGIVIFSKTSKSAGRMNELFRDRKIEKRYLAIVDNRPDPLSGSLSAYIDKIPGKNRVVLLKGPSRRHPKARLAQLEYHLLSEVSGYCLLDISLQTGRRHQIRAQLADIGCPIMRDLKYGGKRISGFDGIFLHAYALGFIHPVKKEPVLIQAPPPKNQIWNLFSEHLEELVSN